LTLPTFTPTQSGVIEITTQAWDGTGTTNSAWFGDLSVTNGGATRAISLNYGDARFGPAADPLVSGPAFQGGASFFKTFTGNDQTQPKLPEESEPFNFDFSKYPEILGGLTILSATVTIRTPLGAQPLTVVAQPSVSGAIVQPQFGGGSAANTYLVVIDATLNNGSVISMFDHISVQAIA
jgi:hypothetical protein